MGFKAITVNTTEESEPHINAADDAALYAGIISSSGILNIGGCMTATVNNSTTITLTDGVAVNNGRYGRIAEGDSETFTIASGEEKKKRIDLIVMRYANEGSRESLSLILVPGTAGNIATPPETKLDDLVLYQINIDGYDVTAERVATLIDGLYLTAQKINPLVNQIDKLNSKITGCMGNVISLEKGTTVVTINTGATSVKFLTGITGNPVIVVTNGDGDANRAHISGVTIQKNGDAYAVLDGPIEYGNIRINYAIIR